MLQIRKPLVRALDFDNDCSVPPGVNRKARVRDRDRRVCAWVRPDVELGTVDPADDGVVASLWTVKNIKSV